jgi:hypothetical protein
VLVRALIHGLNLKALRPIQIIKVARTIQHNQ